MRFLLIGNLTPAVAAAVARHGHAAVTPESVGLAAGASHEEILAAAVKAQLEILTADPDMADAPYAKDIWFPRAIVFLQLAGADVEQDDAIDRLFERYSRLTPKRLYTVTEARVKVRQLPQGV